MINNWKDLATLVVLVAAFSCGILIDRGITACINAKKANDKYKKRRSYKEYYDSHINEVRVEKVNDK